MIIVFVCLGQRSKTVAWSTNVWNEHGQMIMSVLTASEGSGIRHSIDCIVKRYAEAQVTPPEILDVDRDCCGSSPIQRMFSGWKDLQVRLDIWHFMRRISVGCNTDCHRLYGLFMSRFVSASWSGTEMIWMLWWQQSGLKLQLSTFWFLQTKMQRSVLVGENWLFTVDTQLAMLLKETLSWHIWRRPLISWYSWIAADQRRKNEGDMGCQIQARALHWRSKWCFTLCSKWQSDERGMNTAH